MPPRPRYAVLWGIPDPKPRTESHDANVLPSLPEIHQRHLMLTNTMVWNCIAGQVKIGAVTVLVVKHFDPILCVLS